MNDGGEALHWDVKTRQEQAGFHHVSFPLFCLAQSLFHTGSTYSSSAVFALE